VTASDVLYGRRGGGWAPAPARELDDADRATVADARRRNAEARREGCRVCGQTYVHDDGPCWEARARMALAREHAGFVEEREGRDPARLGLTLSPLDIEALDRCPNPGGFVSIGGHS